MEQIKDLQSLIFSSCIDTQLLRKKIIELQNYFPLEKIDKQLILSFSLNYERIPILSPFLSKTEVKANQFIHYDQEFFFHLLKNNISFPEKEQISMQLILFIKIEQYYYSLK